MVIKVLVIVNATFGYDGISSVAMNYYRFFDKKSVKMDLLTINPVFGSFAEDIKKNGDFNFVLSNRNKNPFKYIVELRRIIKKNRYDIVHVHGNSATMAVELLAAKLAGCKVRVAHSHNTRCNHMLLNKLLMPFFSRLYTDCCACSEEAGYFLFPHGNFFVIKNGLYLQKYRFDQQLRNKMRLERNLSGRYIIGHIGRFCFQKNQEYLVKLLAKIKRKVDNAVLLLVGCGETEKIIKNQAVDLGVQDSVIFYGTTDSINEVVQIMDVFAFPSRFEGLGIVAIEAQASGLIVVASDAVPLGINVNEENRFIPVEGHDDEWAEALIELGKSPQERELAAEDNKRRMQTAGFDIEKNCSDVLNYYKTILRKKGPY